MVAARCSLFSWVDNIAQHLLHATYLWYRIIHMAEQSEIPRTPEHSERITVQVLPGTKDALAAIAADAGFPTWSAYVRGVLEREIRDARPEDYRRIKGAA